MKEKASPLRPIRLPCLLEVSGRSFLRGQTLALSDHEATLQLPTLVYPGAKKLEHGASCVLTLGLRGAAGMLREILKIPCKVTYVATIIVGLSINPEPLDERQQKIFAAVLKIKT